MKKLRSRPWKLHWNYSYSLLAFSPVRLLDLANSFQSVFTQIESSFIWSYHYHELVKIKKRILGKIKKSIFCFGCKNVHEKSLGWSSGFYRPLQLTNNKSIHLLVEGAFKEFHFIYPTNQFRRNDWSPWVFAIFYFQLFRPDYPNKPKRELNEYPTTREQLTKRNWKIVFFLKEE